MTTDRLVSSPRFLAAIVRWAVATVGYLLGLLLSTTAWLVATVGPFPEGVAARWEWREGAVLALQMGALGSPLILVGLLLLRGRLGTATLSRIAFAFCLAGVGHFALLGVLTHGLGFWTFWRFAGPILLGVPLVCVVLTLGRLGSRAAGPRVA